MDNYHCIDKASFFFFIAVSIALLAGHCQSMKNAHNQNHPIEHTSETDDALIRTAHGQSSGHSLSENAKDRLLKKLELIGENIDVQYAILSVFHGSASDFLDIFGAIREVNIEKPKGFKAQIDFGRTARKEKELEDKQYLENRDNLLKNAMRNLRYDTNDIFQWIVDVKELFDQQHLTKLRKWRKSMYDEPAKQFASQLVNAILEELDVVLKQQAMAEKLEKAVNHMDQFIQGMKDVRERITQALENEEQLTHGQLDAVYNGDADYTELGFKIEQNNISANLIDSLAQGNEQAFAALLGKKPSDRYVPAEDGDAVSVIKHQLMQDVAALWQVEHAMGIFKESKASSSADNNN